MEPQKTAAAAQIWRRGGRTGGRAIVTGSPSGTTHHVSAVPASDAAISLPKGAFPQHFGGLGDLKHPHQTPLEQFRPEVQPFWLPFVAKTGVQAAFLQPGGPATPPKDPIVAFSA